MENLFLSGEIKNMDLVKQISCPFGVDEIMGIEFK